MNTIVNQVSKAIVRFPTQSFVSVLIFTAGFCIWLTGNALRLNAAPTGQRGETRITVLAAWIGLGLISYFWVTVIRNVHRWRTSLAKAMEERAQAEKALRQSQEQLETRVQQRTAELVAAIEARKQAEETMREKLEEFRAISTAAQDAIITIDNEAGISFWNEAAERIFGFSKSEAMGKELPAFLAPAVYRQKHHSLTAQWRETGQGAAVGKTLELIALRKDGREFPIELSLSTRKVKGRWNAIGIVRDITERMRYESELHQARLAAEAAAQAKGEFLANLSHEIRTPMNGVIGMTNLLLDTELTPQQRHFADIICQSGESLLALMNDILDFSKIEANKILLEILDFDLQEMLEHIVDLMAERAQSNQIKLAAQVSPEVPTRLRGDPGRLRQILLNLIGNAFKFTEHGEVIVRLARQRETATHVSLRFEVHNNGIVVSPKAQQHLVRAFSQADGSTLRKYGGTGLGLVICRQLVELMGGQIGVESRPGKGTQFWFTLTFEKQSAEQSPAIQDNSDLAGLRVLIVDDNISNRKILEHQTGAWKMRSCSAASPIEALRMLREAAAEPYAVALLNMRMPEMNGLSLARAIKADPTMATTRLILFISPGQSLDQADLESAGIEACLSKQVRKSQLFDCLMATMGRRSPPVSGPLVSSAQAGESIRSLHILLVEDDLINQQVAEGQLGKLGISPDVVDNGRAALDAFDLFSYDVVLMDCQMPELDGFQTTQEIRRREQQRACRSVYIIAMTASVMPGSRDKCLAAGMDDYIGKPVRPLELQQALERGYRKKEEASQVVEYLPGQSRAEMKTASEFISVRDATPPGVRWNEPPVDLAAFA